MLTCVPLGKGSDITMSQAFYSKLVSEIGFPPLNVLSYKRIRLNGSCCTPQHIQELICGISLSHCQIISLGE